MIHARLASMEQRLSDHARTASESREDIREIRKRMEDGDRVFADIKSSMAKIETLLGGVVKTQADHQTYLADHNTRIGKIEREESKRDGECGVLAAIVKSPAAAWIAALAAAIWAFISRADSIPPH